MLDRKTIIPNAAVLSWTMILLTATVLPLNERNSPSVTGRPAEKISMVQRKIILAALLLALLPMCCQHASAQQPQAYGATWGGSNVPRDYNRFMHYPYVYYPQNYYGNQYYRSADSLYYRYPAEMQIPAYNKQWHNYYPTGQRYHWGHHFITDVF